MNKKQTLYYLGLSFLVVGFHFTLINFGVLKGLLKTGFVVDGAILGIVLLSARIMYKNNPEKFNFTNRFVLLTAFQFISFLSLIAALTFSNILDLTMWSLSVATIFLLILIIQTVLFLATISGKTTEQTKKESN